MIRGPSSALAFLLAGVSLAAPRPDPRSAAELVTDLRASLDAGDLEGAIRAGKKAIERDPRDSEAHDLLGRAYGLKAQESPLLEQIHLARRARAFFQRAVDLDPGNVAARADLAAYDMRAPAFLGGGKEKARRQIQEVVRLDAARGHELLGDLAERENEPAAAEAQYRLAVQSAPRQARARRALSTFLTRQRRIAEARRVWLEAPEADPADSVARYELAGIALASGEKEGLEAAVRDLEACLVAGERTDGPSRAEVLERLGQVDEKLGRRDRAKAELEEALRLAPHRAEWRRELERLSR